MRIDDSYSQYEMCRIVNLAENKAINDFHENAAFTEKQIDSWKRTVEEGLGADNAFSFNEADVSEESVYAEAYAAKMLALIKRNS